MLELLLSHGADLHAGVILFRCAAYTCAHLGMAKVYFGLWVSVCGYMRAAVWDICVRLRVPVCVFG